ncbi:MAG TPA: multicopper oxidase domain-containing protein [Methylococcus sp.]|nr:multicopper oxidase domain-containing protein [Methylococcus sp.]
MPNPVSRFHFASTLAAFLALPGAMAATRQYYLAAEDQVWDFAPSGQNLVHCHPDPAPCALPEPWTESHRFPVTRFVQYADAEFKTPVPQPEWLGILGPILRAEVGDTLHVRFCNRSGRLAGLHPHGLRYTKEMEGAHYFGANSGDGPGAGAEIRPGQCFDYEWTADRDSGPAAGESSSKVWWYHSHIDEPTDVNQGLLGPIIVTRRGWARPDGSPKDVDQEFVTAFFVFDKAQGEEAGLMHSINGYIFGNLKGLIAPYSQTVRWHVLGMGNEVDLHTPHWHGKILKLGRGAAAQRTDVVSLLPGAMVSADMKADNPGEWLFHCHVSDHIHAGMLTTYRILPPAGK